MDKQTLSNYGWVIITVLVLAVMIALATPFGTYVKEGAKSTLTGLFESSENALNTGLSEAGVTLNKAEFGGVPTVDNNIENKQEVIDGSAIFNLYLQDPSCCSDGVHNEYCNWKSCEKTTLSWNELQLEENGIKYGYNASEISNTNIGDYAFQGCQGLKDITIPNTITSIGFSAFQETQITDITIPNSVTSIGNDAFDYCINLNSIILSDNITIIGEWAFCETGLTNIVLPNSLGCISEGLFLNCYYLTDITIGNKTTSISYSAFENCYSLTSITIPKSVTSIGYYAFGSCECLTDIRYEGTINEWNAIYIDVDWCTDAFGHKVPATVVHCSDGDIAI